MNIRLLSLTSAAALLAATAAFGQSPFPSVSGQPQQQQSSPFPSVSGQPQQSSPIGGAQAPQAGTFSSPSAAPRSSGFPSVSGGGAAPAATPAAMPPMAMPGMPGMGGSMPGAGGMGAPQGQEPPCMADFTKLGKERERRGKLIQAASNRKAPPVEACKLFNSYVDADTQMINFVETNAKSCGIPPNISADLKKERAGAQQVRDRVCAAAQGGGQAAAPKGPSFSDVLGSAALPEANTKTRAGGSTFDTLNGNALSR